MLRPSQLVTWLGTIVFIFGEVRGLGDAIYAVNCGGDAHTDMFGINYEKDDNRVGVSSDYGKQLMIGRVPQQDQILYQTERYHSSTFGYDMPVEGDGDYLLVLKMSEVYFNAPNMKVFDVVLNGDLTVVSDLDIYEKVGRGVAHDEYIEFSIEGNRILYQGEESEISAGMIRVEFIKSYRDNPKINSIVLIKGTLDDWPKLPPLPIEQEEDDVTDEHKESTSARRKPSGPRVADPYAEEDSSSMLPIFVAIGAFIPLVFCLCKL